MTVLFKRRVELTIDTLKIHPDHRITGKVEKTYKPEPNTAEITVYNLTPEQRAQLTSTKNPIVKLAAGYGQGNDGMMQLFYGELMYVKHRQEGPDILTTLTTSDGGAKKQTAHVSLSFGRNTKTGTVLRRIGQALGVDLGNVEAVARELDSGAQANMYIEGASFEGSAADELSHLLRSCGYDWSIQDQCLALRKLGKPVDGFAVELNPTTGLIESPTIDNKGVCTGQSLIFKAGSGLDLVPGRLVHVTSQFVKGQFILAKCNYDLDNYVENWFVNFEAVTSKGALVKVG